MMVYGRIMTFAITVVECVLDSVFQANLFTNGEPTNDMKEILNIYKILKRKKSGGKYEKVPFLVLLYVTEIVNIQSQSPFKIVNI